MSKPILRCCENRPVFLVTYDLGSQYMVCGKCISIDYWSRGIKEKKEIE